MLVTKIKISKGHNSSNRQYIKKKTAGAQLPIVGSISVKFQQNWSKTVGEEMHTNYFPYIVYVGKNFKGA